MMVYSSRCSSVTNSSCRLQPKQGITWVIYVAACVLTASVAQGQAQQVVATVDGESITQEMVDAEIASQLFPLQKQIFALRNAALQNLIIHQLLVAEAKRQGTSLDQLKRWMMVGDVTVTPEQVEKLYLQNHSAFASMNPDEVREKLRFDLESQARLQLYRAKLARIREQARIEIFLSEPRLAINVSSNPAAIRGPSGSKIVITEFSDFQCPFCRQAEPVIRKILEDYRDTVRLDFRQLPLEIHPFALPAAKGSYCAGQQGKFWEYHDAVFDLSSLSQESLNQVVKDLQIDLVSFEKCLTSTQSQAAIDADLREAIRLGVNGTPTLLINGRPFGGPMRVEDLKREIDEELESIPSASVKKKTSTLLNKGIKK
jgi:protein-disulfide isomerase